MALLVGQYPLVAAALMLALWVIGSGGLHLDGLADCADAWVGGQNRQRTLEIMKDPACGPMGVLALLLVLLLKFVLLHALLVSAANPWILILVPLLGRAGILLTLLMADYLRPQGIAATLVAHAPRRHLWGLLIMCGLLVGMAGPPGLVLVAGGVISWGLWHRAVVRRLGGFTGDTLGAGVELTELGALLALFLLLA